jgi:hypothetical protein
MSASRLMKRANVRILANSATTSRAQIFDFVGTRVHKQFFHARFEAFKNIFFIAPTAATSTQAGGSRESFRSYRQPFKTTRRDPFDTSASRRKIGDSLEVVALVYV